MKEPQLRQLIREQIPINYHKLALKHTEHKALNLVDKFWSKFGGKECNEGFCDIYAYKLYDLLPNSKIWHTEEENNTFGHVWVEYNNKYYDAETPQGVGNYKELPWVINFYNKHNRYPEIELLKH